MTQPPHGAPHDPTGTGGAADGAQPPPAPREPLLARVTGTGGWPAGDPLEAARTVLGELGEPTTPPGLPHVVEMPTRGPGAEPVGRTAALLAGLAVDLQPSGWRLVDRPGRDAARADAWRRADLDALAEAADGWDGPLKAQVAGPWTLAASLRLHRGERAVSDAGARRDLAESLAEGLVDHLAALRGAVPGARWVVQLDEPSLPSVLDGRLRRSSGFGHLEPVRPEEVEVALRTVVAGARRAGATDVVVRCGGAGAPVGVLVAAGADGVGVDVDRLGTPGWDAVAAAVEAGVRLWAGVPSSSTAAAGTTPDVEAARDAVAVPWRRVGLPAAGLADVVLTPAGSLEDRSPAAARAALRRLRGAAEALGEVAVA